MIRVRLARIFATTNAPKSLSIPSTIVILNFLTRIQNVPQLKLSLPYLISLDFSLAYQLYLHLWSLLHALGLSCPFETRMSRRQRTPSRDTPAVLAWLSEVSLASHSSPTSGLPAQAVSVFFSLSLSLWICTSVLFSRLGTRMLQGC